MSILVTGCAGFIGSHLVERLLKEMPDKNVVGVDEFNSFYDPRIKQANIADAEVHPRFHLIHGDLSQSHFVELLFDSYDFDVVVHLAARAGVRSSIAEPMLYQIANNQATSNLLEVSRRHDLTRFVFGSSSSVYGKSRRVPFREDDPCLEPISPYAASKRANELLCYTYHHLYDLSIACLRFFTVYGPRQRPDMAIHKFTKLIDRDRPIAVYGDGTSARDYTFFDDILDGIVAAMKTEVGFEIFNLGNNQTVRLLDLIEKIGDAVGKKPRVEFGPEQPGDVPITYADISKAQRMLWYNPKTNIDEGIARFVEWYHQMAGRLDALTA